MTKEELAQFEIFHAELQAAELYKDWQKVADCLAWLEAAIQGETLKGI